MARQSQSPEGQLGDALHAQQARIASAQQPTAAPANPPARSRPARVRNVALAQNAPANPPAQVAQANQAQAAQGNNAPANQGQARGNAQANRNAQNAQAQAPANPPARANHGCRNMAIVAAATALIMLCLGGIGLIWLFGGGVSLPPLPPIGATPVPTAQVPFKVDPQPQVRHPSMYWETGVSGTQGWQGSIPAGSTLIVGGVCVDGLCDGTYKAIAGPKDVSLKVQNGFVLVIESKWAQEEWCFRIGQTVQYGWAHKNLSPLSGWTCPTK